MGSTSQTMTILMADDDFEDRLLTRHAVDEIGLRVDLRFVGDGEELMEYLSQVGQYADPASSPRPDLILLDLYMPKKDGREALEEIKSDRDLRRIPVVVFSASSVDEDVSNSYDLGANSVLAKPASFEALVRTMRNLSSYWFEMARLPGDVIGGRHGRTPS